MSEGQTPVGIENMQRERDSWSVCAPKFLQDLEPIQSLLSSKPFESNNESSADSNKSTFSKQADKSKSGESQ